jgi:hypothetical protein
MDCFAFPSHAIPGFLTLLLLRQKGLHSSPVFSRESPRTVQDLLDALPLAI